MEIWCFFFCGIKYSEFAVCYYDSTGMQIESWLEILMYYRLNSCLRSKRLFYVDLVGNLLLFQGFIQNNKLCDCVMKCEFEVDLLLTMVVWLWKLFSGLFLGRLILWKFGKNLSFSKSEACLSGVQNSYLKENLISLIIFCSGSIQDRVNFCPQDGAWRLFCDTLHHFLGMREGLVSRSR